VTITYSENNENVCEKVTQLTPGTLIIDVLDSRPFDVDPSEQELDAGVLLHYATELSATLGGSIQVCQNLGQCRITTIRFAAMAEPDLEPPRKVRESKQAEELVVRKIHGSLVVIGEDIWYN
jgi:hypothetical protein